MKIVWELWTRTSFDEPPYATTTTDLRGVFSSKKKVVKYAKRYARRLGYRATSKDGMNYERSGVSSLYITCSDLDKTDLPDRPSDIRKALRRKARRKP